MAAKHPMAAALKAPERTLEIGIRSGMRLYSASILAGRIIAGAAGRDCTAPGSHIALVLCAAAGVVCPAFRLSSVFAPALRITCIARADPCAFFQIELPDDRPITRARRRAAHRRIVRIIGRCSSRQQRNGDYGTDKRTDLQLQRSYHAPNAPYQEAAPRGKSISRWSSPLVADAAQLAAGPPHTDYQPNITDFVSVNASTPIRPFSRPIPDWRKPPNGRANSMPDPLTLTEPDRSRRASACALPRLLVQT